MQYCLKLYGDIDVDKLVRSDLKEMKINQNQLSTLEQSSKYSYIDNDVPVHQPERKNTKKIRQSFRRMGNMGPLPRSFHTDSEIDSILQYNETRRPSAIQFTYSKVKKLVKSVSYI